MDMTKWHIMKMFVASPQHKGCKWVVFPPEGCDVHYIICDTWDDAMEELVH